MSIIKSTKTFITAGFISVLFILSCSNKKKLRFETNNNYELVWSDEFNYKGKPDSTKWNYNYGFRANEEKQYYTDSLKNARVEKGHLIIEAHKEKVANKDFNNPDLECSTSLDIISSYLRGQKQLYIEAKSYSEK